MDIAALPWELIIGGIVGLVGLIFGKKKGKEARQSREAERMMAREAQENRKLAETRAGEAMQNRKAAATMAEAICETGSKDAARRVRARKRTEPTIGKVIDEIVEAAGVNVFKYGDEAETAPPDRPKQH